MKRNSVRKEIAFFTTDGKHWQDMQEAEAWQFRLDLAEWLLQHEEIYWREPNIDVIVYQLMKHFTITPREDD
jgi:hypothetical protein